MYVSLYRYTLPSGRVDDFLALQRRVATAYRRVGCKQSLLLRPVADGGDWVDISVFDSKAQAASAEQHLSTCGIIGPLFQEFLEITGLREEDIRQEEYELAVEESLT